LRKSLEALNLNREYDFEQLAREYGFNVREIEKVCRISDVLEDISATRFLRDRLSLYGGTALAFIYSKRILRLSIDVDLNYRHIDEKDWGEVRSEIDEKIKNLLYRQGYKRDDLAISPTYPLARFNVQYENKQGLRDSFRIEVGYMRRYPILKDDMLADFKHVGTRETFLIKTPQREELFANKWCALLYRTTSRDLFDVYQIESLEMDLNIFRKCAIVDTLMRGKPKIYEININEAINRIPINSSLKNLLQVEMASTFNFNEIRSKVIQFSESIMANITRNEVKAIDQFFEDKRFSPELIDEEEIFHEKIKGHPAIRWILSALN